MMTPDERTEALIADAVHGDVHSLEELLCLHYGVLETHLRPRIPTALRPLLAVEDLLQQTFVDAFRSIGSFKPRGSESFAAWLRTIADHRLSDTLRLLRCQKRGNGRTAVSAIMTNSGSLVQMVDRLLDDGPTPAHSVARHEAVQAVQVRIARLPPDQQQALVHHYIEGLSVEQTAAAMRRTVGAVRGLLFRGKQALLEACGQSTLWFSRR